MARTLDQDPNTAYLGAAASGMLALSRIADSLLLLVISAAARDGPTCSALLC
jgi:hypothetical protein